MSNHAPFVGSRSYPGRTELEDFFHANGGWINATTASRETNFYFEVCYHLYNMVHFYRSYFISTLLNLICLVIAIILPLP